VDALHYKYTKEGEEKRSSEVANKKERKTELF
jgi:hypothetical protein